MKIKNVKVYGLEESIVRSGYPMQVGSIDTIKYTTTDKFFDGEFYKDKKRALKLAKTPSGSGHDNFLKGVIVQFDLQYPEYFSPQLQRYNWIDIVSSQSKMHKLTSRRLEIEDFSDGVAGSTIDYINALIGIYNITKDSRDFQKLISNLPSGYLKWMGVTTNYLQLKTIYKQRKNHKLTEWKEFCNFIETLPMAKELITIK